MPYTKFRVIDESPPPDTPGDTQQDEWGYLESDTTAVGLGQLPGAEGHGVTAPDGTPGSRVCMRDGIALNTGQACTVWIEHELDGVQRQGQYVKFEFPVPADVSGEDTLTLYVAVNDQQQYYAGLGAGDTPIFVNQIGEVNQPLPDRVWS